MLSVQKAPQEALEKAQRVGGKLNRWDSCWRVLLEAEARGAGGSGDKKSALEAAWWPVCRGAKALRGLLRLHTP